MTRIQDDGRSVWSRSTVYKFVKGSTRYSDYEDPTYLGFVFIFDPTSPLLDIRDNKPGTALTYLKNINENLRAEYLKLFIENLFLINREMPWYWQSFEGAEELWKYNSFNEPFKGGSESVINIECLESIDMKITMLMDLYRKAVYDQQYKRVVLPENLRKFNMWIYVQEVRKFHVDSYVKARSGISPGQNSGTSNINSSENRSDISSMNENAPYIFWHLKFCEFDPDASSVAFTGLNMIQGDSAAFAKQKLSIKYELVLEPGNFYPTIDSTISSVDTNIPAKNKEIRTNNFEDRPDGDNRTDFQKRLDSARKRIEDKGKRISEDYETRIRGAANRYNENIYSEVENIAESFAAKVLLGNVYGATNNIISTLEAGSVLSLGPNLINQILNQNNETKSGQDLGNVYE